MGHKENCPAWDEAISAGECLACGGTFGEAATSVPTEKDMLRAFQFCRRHRAGDNFYKVQPCEQCKAIAEYGIRERKAADEAAVARANAIFAQWAARIKAQVDKVEATLELRPSESCAVCGGSLTLEAGVYSVVCGPAGQSLKMCQKCYAKQDVHYTGPDHRGSGDA